VFQQSTAHSKSYSVQFRPKDSLLVKHCWLAVTAAEGAGRLGGMYSVCMFHKVAQQVV